MVAVMGDVFALVYNFHVPLSLKAKLSVQWGWLLYNLGLYLLACWPDGCGVMFYSGLFSVCVYLLFLGRGVVCVCCWWSFCVFRCNPN
jgi:hypothetical protein